MFGIDWNLDGKIDLVDDFLTLSMLDDGQESGSEEKPDDDNENWKENMD